MNVVLASTLTVEELETILFKTFYLRAVAAEVTELTAETHRVSFENNVRPVDWKFIELFNH